MTRRSIEQDIARQMRAAERERRRMTVAAVLIGGAFTLGGALLALGWLMQPASTERAASPRPVKSLVPPVAAETTAADAQPEPEPVPAEEPARAAVEPSPADTQIVSEPTKKEPAVQRLAIRIGELGYEPAVVSAKAGAPIVLTVAQGDGCAAGFLIPQLGIAADNSVDDAEVELPALPAGTYRFTCGMEMVEGRLVVQ